MKAALVMLLLVAMIIVDGGAAAPSQAPAPAVDCITELLTLSDCLTYVTGNGSVAPTEACCSELSSVLSTAPLCLCQLFNTTLVESFGLSINYTAADQLPSLCHVSAPSRSQCPGAGEVSPAASPVSEAPSSSISEPPSTLAPSPDVLAEEDCSVVLLTLADCLDYVTGNGSAPPTKACCNELSAVVETQATCLCQLFNTTFTGQFGVPFNLTASIALPDACQVVTPPPSTCALLGIPVPSPSGTAPAASPPGPSAGGSSSLAGSPGNSAPTSRELLNTIAMASTVASVATLLMF